MPGRIKRAMARWLNTRQPGDILIGDGAISQTGMPITTDTAMRLSTVHACVRVLSEDIAALPVHVYSRGSDGSRRRERQHPLYTLLHDAPNAEMTAISFKEALMVNLLLTGNAYAYIEYDSAGRVKAMWPLLSSEVEPMRSRSGEIVYHVNSMEIPAAEILHIPGLGYDGLMGLSPIGYAREALGLAAAAENFGSTLFKNGTHLGGVVTLKGSLSDAAFERMRAQFGAMYRGLQNAHGVPVLEEGAEFKSIGISPEDAQFLETRKFQRSEIAAIYRVPPHLIGDLDKATFSNIEHQDLAYLQRALLPWLVRWEQAMQQKLLLDREKAQLFIEFDTANFMRGDTKSRMEAYATAIQNGVMTPNEARARENLNPVEGGDVILLPLNMTPAGDSEGGLKPGANAQAGAARMLARDFMRSESAARDRERRAAGADETEKRLRKGFAAWLKRQARDILEMARDALGKRSRVDDLIAKINAYYMELANAPIPGDIESTVSAIARDAFKKVRAECPGATISEQWISGFLRNYYQDTAQRIASANGNDINRTIKATIKDDDIYEALERKLSEWGTDRAATMAANERMMAMNNALIAGYREAGYYSTWKSGAGCCRVCKALDGQRISRLRPPLHVGCTCGVERGQKNVLSGINKDDILNADDYDKRLAKAGSYIKGKLIKPSVPDDLESISFDDYHTNIMRNHGVNANQAKNFIREAIVCNVRGDRYMNYYSLEGAAYTIIGENKIQTAVRAEEYYPNIVKMMEVMANVRQQA